ncbi:MAG TPA: acetate kinase [Thauera sp.]|uniref:type IV pilus assembly protein FimV n=1 Tax=Thauera sp. TaxID=1905334 RepID=UPI002B565EBD|nr:acetate kinase [Thauera sp.]HRP23101.1 acetate kinase [Thauera sp.]HRP66521.1 acetate kinase [Thauera sp.]
MTFEHPPRRLARPLLGLLVAAMGGAAVAADGAEPVSFDAQFRAQMEQIEALKRELARQEASLNALRREVDLERRGRGGEGAAPAPDTAVVAQAGNEPPVTPVGQAPAAADRPPEVAPIFEQPGVLTPPGKWIVEPSLQYSYSSSDRIALVGYTVIPAILIGLIDVRNVKSNALTATMAFRRGITNRFELEARVPYVYRYDDTRGREIFTGTPGDEIFTDVDGKGLGDVELIGRYQLNDGGGDSPYYIASLRLKSRTGKDPFEVLSSFEVDGARVSAVQQELPTGSGFYSVTPGLTVLIPSDPAVFFGGVSYQYSFKRNGVRPNVVPETQLSEYAEIQPGGVIGFNFGMGLALNERSSFSIGYDHLSVGKTKAVFASGERAPGLRVQMGTLLLGYSYKVDSQKTLNMSLGVGVTRDTPDVQLTVRMPFSL